jgi:flotillin
VLNFTYVEAASEKLGATLREMFVGAARRLVANLSLDDCLTRRKETIAGYLMAEIAPVVGGEGAADDTTNRGWGVVIDTIEIQQVRVQSEHVFAALQAPFRAAIAGRAELAELDRKRAVAERRAITDREIRAFAAQAEAEAIEREREHRRAKAAADAAALEAEHVRLEAMQRQSLFELEHALELRRREADARERDNVLEAVHQQRLGDLEQRLAQIRAMQALIAGLPQIAQALRQQVGELHVTQIGPGEVLGSVPAAIAQLVALAKSLGLELAR